jgi:hypothetical protein
MAAMVPSSWHRRIQQLANMLCDKSMLLKLESIIDFTMYLSFSRETSQSPGTLIVDQPTDQQMTNKQPTTNQLTAEELKYSRNRPRRH